MSFFPMLLDYGYFIHDALYFFFPRCCAVSTVSILLRAMSTFVHAAPLRLLSCADPGIFVGEGGGGPGQSDKKSFDNVFFSSQLILQKSNGYNFQRKLSFFKVPEGVQPFPGGRSNFFPGRGFNCVFPIEPHITCDFPGGPDPPAPSPPSGSALDFFHFSHAAVVCLLFHAAPPHLPPPPTTIPRSAHTCTILQFYILCICTFTIFS